MLYRCEKYKECPIEAGAGGWAGGTPCSRTSGHREPHEHNDICDIKCKAVSPEGAVCIPVPEEVKDEPSLPRYVLMTRFDNPSFDTFQCCQSERKFNAEDLAELNPGNVIAVYEIKEYCICPKTEVTWKEVKK